MPARLFDERGGRKAWREVDPHDSAASLPDDVVRIDIAPDAAVGTPVGACHKDVRLNPADDRVRRVLVNNERRVHRVEREQQLGTLVLRVDRPVISLVCANRSIGVDGHHQRIAERSCFSEKPDVAGVEKIEHAAGEDDPSVARTDPIGEGRRLAGGRDAADARFHCRPEMRMPPENVQRWGGRKMPASFNRDLTRKVCSSRW